MNKKGGRKESGELETFGDVAALDRGPDLAVGVLLGPPDASLAIFAGHALIGHDTHGAVVAGLGTSGAVVILATSKGRKRFSCGRGQGQRAQKERGSKEGGLDHHFELLIEDVFSLQLWLLLILSK